MTLAITAAKLLLHNNAVMTQGVAAFLLRESVPGDNCNVKLQEAYPEKGTVTSEIKVFVILLDSSPNLQNGLSKRKGRNGANRQDKDSGTNCNGPDCSLPLKRCFVMVLPFESVGFETCYPS